jgi:hypothetical protein
MGVLNEKRCKNKNFYYSKDYILKYLLDNNIITNIDPKNTEEEDKKSIGGKSRRNKRKQNKTKQNKTKQKTR